MSNPSTKDRDFGQSMGEKAKDTAHNIADKAKDAGAAVVDKAKDIASQAGDKVKQAASAVGDAVGGAATTAGKTADKWTASAGTGIKNLGETLEQKGPHEGVLGNATRAVATTLEDTGRYIEQEGLSGMMDDVTDIVRRHPLPAVLVGIGLGFLLGRTLGS